MKNQLVIGSSHVTVEQIAEISKREVSIKLDDSEDYVRKIRRGPELIAEVLEKGGTIYGVTTGVGDNVISAVSKEHHAELPPKVIEFHGVALGPYFSEEIIRAIVASRFISLAKGYSGVRYELLQQLEALLKHDILPRIPQQGPVGASGDLACLSYVGQAIMGQKSVLYQGEVRDAAEVFQEVGLKPLMLQHKETLAVMNGTSVMSSLASIAYLRAKKISQLSTRISAIVVAALKGNKFHYDEALYALKPHPGSVRVARRIRQDLKIPDASGQDSSSVKRLQDRYSLRCAPYVIGVLEECLDFSRDIIEREYNSVNDNPVIDVDNEQIHHGGHFYGGHMAMVTDLIKSSVASVADLMDRQMAMLVDPRFNNGLPPGLTGAEESRKSINHALRGLQITMSGWTAEALQGTMPCSSFSRSTELHNQDKVSMGTMAARECHRVIDLCVQVVAGMLMAISQAVKIRRLQNEPMEFSEDVEEFLTRLDDIVPFIEEDIFPEPILRKLVTFVEDIETVY